MSIKIVPNSTVNRIATFAGSIDGLLPPALSASEFARSLRLANEVAFGRQYPQADIQELDEFVFELMPLESSSLVLQAIEEYVYNFEPEIDRQVADILGSIRSSDLFRSV